MDNKIVDVLDVGSIGRGGIRGGGYKDGQRCGGVVAIVSIEGGGGGGRVGGIVVGKLNNGQPGSPVIMAGVDIGTEDLFNGAVGAF